jgi:hypothetical protein
VDKNLQSGGVYKPVGKPVDHAKQSKGRALEKELWDWMEKEFVLYL